MAETKRVPWEDVKHAADVDLRMVQVGAVAVGREVLRLAGEVDAGRLAPERARAVMVGCHNLPDTLAQTLTAGVKGSVACTSESMSFAEAKRRFPNDQLPGTRARLCGTTSSADGLASIMVLVGEAPGPESYGAVARALDAVGFTMNSASIRPDVPPPVHGRVGDVHMSPGSWTVSATPKRHVTPEVDWVKHYAAVCMAMTLAETDSMPRPALEAAVRAHMDAPMPIPSALSEHYAERWTGALPEVRELAATLYARRHYHTRLHTRAVIPKLEDCPPMERVDWLEMACMVRTFMHKGLDSITSPALLALRECFVVEEKPALEQSAPVRGVRHG